MFDIIGRLEECELVAGLEVLDLVDEDEVRYIKLKAALKDGSLLSVIELAKPEHSRYSYHWQDKDGKLIARWDNAPHHRDVDTYPDHIHTGGKVGPSFKPTPDEMVEYISRKLGGQRGAR